MTHRHVQQLEFRRVRYSHYEPIIVHGSDGADRIDITVHNDLTIVRIENANGVTEDRYGLVSGLPLSWFEVDAHAGDDVLRLHGSVRYVQFNGGEGYDQIDLSRQQHNTRGEIAAYGNASGQLLQYGSVLATGNSLAAGFYNVENVDMPQGNHELRIYIGHAPRPEFVSVRVNLGSGVNDVLFWREPAYAPNQESIGLNLVADSTRLHLWGSDPSGVKITAPTPHTSTRLTRPGNRSVSADVLA